MTGSELDGFVDLLVAGPPGEARAMAARMVGAGRTARMVFLDVLAPAMREVGTRWQRGRISVAQEHLATAIVSSIMAVLAEAMEEPPRVGRRGVLACGDSELHDVGLRMVGDFLEADGWEILYLGAATPGPDLTGLVADMRPDLVGLSTTLTTHLDAVRQTIAALRALPTPPYIVVGGRAYGDDPDLALRIGAHAFASDAGEASRSLRAHFDAP